MVAKLSAELSALEPSFERRKRRPRAFASKVRLTFPGKIEREQSMETFTVRSTQELAHYDFDADLCWDTTTVAKWLHKYNW